MKLLKLIYHCVTPQIVQKLVTYTFHKDESNKEKELLDEKILQINRYYSDKVISADLRENIDYINKKRRINFFNSEFEENIDYKWVKVYWDKNVNLRYVLHNGRRLYFKRSMFKEDIKRLYHTITKIEQHECSPHLYLDDEIRRFSGNIAVECGAAEGSFSLDIIDQVSKIVIIECDLEWVEALHATFDVYGEKVEIVPRYVSDVCDTENITIDELLMGRHEDVAIIKMDIEGYEPYALRGCRQIISESKNLVVLACAYHNFNDEREIRNQFDEAMYDVDARQGWICVDTPQGFVPPYFRRGVIKATRKQQNWS